MGAPVVTSAPVVTAGPLNPVNPMYWGGYDGGDGLEDMICSGLVQATCQSYVGQCVWTGLSGCIEGGEGEFESEMGEGTQCYGLALAQCSALPGMCWWNGATCVEADVLKKARPESVENKPVLGIEIGVF